MRHASAVAVLALGVALVGAERRGEQVSRPRHPVSLLHGRVERDVLLHDERLGRRTPAPDRSAALKPLYRSCRSWSSPS